MALFEDFFGPAFTANLQPEDKGKAKALLAVVCKSTASLGDVVTLADALGLKLSIQAASAPKPTKPE